jgi:hypothetical protein
VAFSFSNSAIFAFAASISLLLSPSLAAKHGNEFSE